VLAGGLVIAAYVALSSLEPGPAARPAGAKSGTAILGTATCADWQRADPAKRLAIVQTLGVAATQPDPENPGATLATAAAYGLFHRACSTRISRSTLLYETYNRAASFQSVRAGSGPLSSALGHP